MCVHYPKVDTNCPYYTSNCHETGCADCDIEREYQANNSDNSKANGGEANA